MAAAHRRRGRRSIGLALAGGGPAGAVYEIGVLRALEEALEGVDFEDLSCYVGVSAGAFIAACLANGLTPAQQARALLSHHQREHPFHSRIFFTPAWGEWARRAGRLPRLAGELVAELVAAPDDRSLFGVLSHLGGAVPAALFDNEPIRRYLQGIFSPAGRTDDFRQLQRDLVVVAADLASGRAVRFGDPGLDHVPISRAVQASAALPGVYPPVLVDGRYCVDGVLLKTLHASVLLERRVKLAICINPIVPVDTAAAVRSGALPPWAIVRRGLPAILSQTFRTMIHSRMEVGMAAYQARYPDADVVLFEPGRDEYAMFFQNMFSFRARRSMCELAWRATRRDLLARADELGPIFERHGVRLRMDVLRDRKRTLWAGLTIPESPMDAKASRGMSRALAELEEAIG